MKKVLKIFMIFLIGDIFGSFCMYYFCKNFLSQHLSGGGFDIISPDKKHAFDFMRFGPTYFRKSDGELTEISPWDPGNRSNPKILSYFSQAGDDLREAKTKEEWSKDGNSVKVFYPDRFMDQDVTMVFSYNLKTQNWILEKTTPLKTFKQPKEQ
jgi:hypothetical protein